MSALKTLPYKSLTRKAFRSEVYRRSYTDVHFVVCPSYRDSTVIVTDIDIKLRHISLKQTLTEIHPRFWICSGRCFMRNILSKCLLCRRFERPRYSYPTTPPLTKLRLENNYAFYVSSVDNFGSLYVKDTLIRIVMNCVMCG